MKLSNNQQQAAEYIDSPCIISAGPGAGKTYTITHKFFNLVTKYNFNPNRILCITFTNKAAEELKNRVSQKLNVGYLKWIRTIHSACLQLLKPHLYKLQYRENFTIITSSKQNTIIKNILISLNINPKNGVTGDYASMVSRSKDHPNPVKFIQNECKTVSRGREVFVRYQEILHENNLLDFDDILHNVYFLLRTDPEFKQEVLSFFDYILVDEYQDVNNIQYLIIKELGNNITVVGDDSQSIYAFRGSDPKYFINFQQNYENAKLIKLEQNYRSANSIVQLSQNIISKNTNQLQKNCYSELCTTVKPKVVYFDDDAQEITAIVKACKKYISDGFNLDEIAILYRIKTSSRIIEHEFNRHNIPHKIINDVSFYERKEIKDLMAYLLFLYNFNDSISFERLIQVPKRGIGNKTIELINSADGNNFLDRIKNSLMLFHGMTFSNIQNVITILETAYSLPFKEVLPYIISEIKYDEYIRNTCDDSTEIEDRLLNVTELVNISNQYETIAEFLEDSSLISIDDHVDNSPKIKLMTIHAAKGLEFKVVFIVGLEEGTLPHYRALRSLGETKDINCIEEERRLFYVACTRSANVLNISSCINRGWMHNLKPSRFISELDVNLFNEFNMVTQNSKS